MPSVHSLYMKVSYARKTMSESIFWNAQQHTLTINLQPLNIDSQLMLTAWRHPKGITWSVKADNVLSVHQDYILLSAPYFPVWEKLDTQHEAIRAWFEQIPPAVHGLQHYRADSFGLLMMLSRYPQLVPHFLRWPTVFWYAYRCAVKRRVLDEPFVGIWEQHGQDIERRYLKRILRATGLCYTTQLEFISRISAENFGGRQHALIQQALKILDYEYLNQHYEWINEHALQCWLTQPSLQYATTPNTTYTAKSRYWGIVCKKAS